MKYRSLKQAQEEPSKGEVNNDPSMTVEGEYMEMKDILDHAKKGSHIHRNDVQYFRPEEIQQINSLFRNSMDLTDIDQLQAKTKIMNQKLEKAQKRKQDEKAELEKAMEESKKDTSGSDPEVE